MPNFCVTLALGPEEELKTSFPWGPDGFLFPFTGAPALCLPGLCFTTMRMMSLDNSHLGRFLSRALQPDLAHFPAPGTGNAVSGLLVSGTLDGIHVWKREPVGKRGRQSGNLWNANYQLKTCNSLKASAREQLTQLTWIKSKKSVGGTGVCREICIFSRLHLLLWDLGNLLWVCFHLAKMGMIILFMGCKD